MKRILFVCLGNICRSPAAEGVMQHLVNERGLGDEIEVDSAGTSSYHLGEPADKRMRQAAKSRSIELTSLSRMVSARDLGDFDWVIAMDNDNFNALNRLDDAGGGRIKMMSDYLPDDGPWPRDVPDPYYGGPEGFDHVLDMLEAACPALLDEVVSS
ncbi:MAG: low molecular weight protein-tyrosine-phosphatase [Pirellulaceae bacterium]